jgi:hypothetical protein
MQYSSAQPFPDCSKTLIALLTIRHVISQMSRSCSKAFIPSDAALRHVGPTSGDAWLVEQVAEFLCAISMMPAEAAGGMLRDVTPYRGE